MKTELFSTRLRRPNQGDEPTRPDYLPEELRLVAVNREEIKQLSVRKPARVSRHGPLPSILHASPTVVHVATLSVSTVG